MTVKSKIFATFMTIAVLMGMTGFTVNATVKAEAITFLKASDARVRVGYAITREAVTKPERLAVKYSSSDASVASVNENGKVTGRKLGTAVITATSGERKASYRVNVVETVSTKAFDGFSVAVLDKTTPATHSGGYDWPITVWYFTTADGTPLGHISGKDAFAIIEKNANNIPQDGWDIWFANEFNKYRGFNAEGARAAADADMVERYREEVIRLVNIERKKAGRAPLDIDGAAMRYAQTRAEELCVSYSHTRPDGLNKPYDELGAMNENIAMGQGTPKRVVEAWMNSPGHRANILNRDAYAIGVGCYWNGITFFWSQEFLW